MSAISRSFWITLFAVGACAAACSSTDDATNTGTGYGSGGTGGVFDATGTSNGKRISQECACEASVAELNAAALRLGCTLSQQPVCPTFVQQSLAAPDTASDLDFGTFGKCVTFLQGLASCDDLFNKPCTYLPITGAATTDASMLNDSSESTQLASESAAITNQAVQGYFTTAIAACTPTGAAGSGGSGGDAGSGGSDSAGSAGTSGAAGDAGSGGSDSAGAGGTTASAGSSGASGAGGSS